MDKILIILIISTLISCKVSSDLVQHSTEVSNEGSTILDGNTLYNQLMAEGRDSTFSCNESSLVDGLKFNIESQSIEVDNQVGRKAKCFCTGAYQGNVVDLEILQLLHLNHRRFLCKDYRGSLFFLTVLNRANDFIPIDSPDSPNDGLTMFETNFRGKIYDMIRTIDGYPPGSYYVLYLRNVRKMTDVRMAEIMDNDNVAWAKLEYEALLYAWENGLVVLKDYGEE